MRYLALLNAAFAGTVSLLATLGAAAAPPLQSYNLIPGTTSVMGFSIGAFMSVQEGVAYSGLYPGGMAVFAGAPYDCARNQIEEDCRSDATPSITMPIANMQNWSGNLIDSVANLAKMPIYLWVGTEDYTVGQNPMNQLNAQLLNFAPAASIRYDVIQGAGHVFTYGNDNGPANALTQFYGTVNPPAANPSGQLMFFDQTEFIGPNLGMDPNGLIYVPTACANGAPCKLVVWFHGSYGNYNQAGLSYFQYFTLNYYADTNNLIILYPQTIASTNPLIDLTGQTVINTYGFWDYRGMYGANYDQHGGAQVAAVAAMVRKIMGGATSMAPSGTPQAGFWWNPATPGIGYSLEVSPTDGSLYFTASLYDATGNPIWYSATLTSSAGNIYVGPLVEYQGGQTLGGPYQPPGQQSAVGSMSIVFPTPTTAAMSIVAPGHGTTNVSLQRYQFAPNGLNMPPASGQAQTGWWWNPAQTGSGWFLEVQNNVLQIAAYVYGSEGSPVWYVGQNTLSSDGNFSSSLVQYGGGQTLGGAFAPASVANANAANVTIIFSAPNQAMLTFQNGTSIPIQRYLF